jgi:hypothetical protein
MTAPDWFVTPPRENTPSVYWFWHRRPSADEVRAQVAEIAAGGFGTFLIQARLAYPIDQYLDEGFLRAYRLAMKEAQAHGLDVGIYDDYNWASGHAGGKTVAGRDELRERHLFWASSTGRELAVANIASVGGDGMGPAIRNWWYDDGRQEWTDWEIVAVLAHGADGDAIGGARDITASAQIVGTSTHGCQIRLGSDPPAGSTVSAFVSARCATSRLINYLLPEAAVRFTEVGYDPIFDAVGEYFGDPIRYLFIDHPQPGYYTWDDHRGPLGSSVLYAPPLPDAFAREHGYPFTKALLALAGVEGPESEAARADFFQTYANLACETFLGTIARWGADRGIGLAGHEMLGHIGGWELAGRYYGKTDTRIAFGDDFFAIDGYRTHTTVDASNFQPQVTARVGDSVARSHGRGGCILEQYAISTTPGVPGAAGQWDLTLETLRTAAIRHHLFGTKQFLFHGYYQTDGDDTLETFSNARWDFAPGINYEPWYAVHADFAAESARLSAFIFTAEPACDAAVLYPRVTRWAEPYDWEPFAIHSGFWLEHLSRAGLTFHLFDERELDAASVHDGRLHLGSRTYSNVIVPAAPIVTGTRLIELLLELVESGGRAFVTGPPPTVAQSGAQLAPAVAKLVEHEHTFASEDVPDWDAVARVLGPPERPHVVTPPEAIVWQWAGHDGDAWRLALFNEGDRDVTLDIDGPLERWGCATGTVTAASAPIVLAPLELACLRLIADDAPKPTVAPRAVEFDTLDAGWTLESNGHAARPVDVTRGWEEQGLETYSGPATYRIVRNLPDAAEWELELPSVHTAAELRVNGTAVGRRGWRPYRFRFTSQPGDTELQIVVWNTAANRYYVGTPYAAGRSYPSGLAAAPILHRLEPGDA